MFSPALTFLFIVAAIAGLLLLIRSISKMVALYNNPNSVQFSAMESSSTFELRQPGIYEIAVKRPSLFGIIPYKVSFGLIDLKTGHEVTVSQKLNLFSQRKNMSGERIVPIGEFQIAEAGKFQLTNSSVADFKEKDKIFITPATGAKGFLLIFAILFSAIIFIGGLVFTLLSFLKK